jgi:hypothetical protein
MAILLPPMLPHIDPGRSGQAPHSLSVSCLLASSVPRPQ